MRFATLAVALGTPDFKARQRARRFVGDFCVVTCEDAIVALALWHHNRYSLAQRLAGHIRPDVLPLNVRDVVAAFLVPSNLVPIRMNNRKEAALYRSNRSFCGL